METERWQLEHWLAAPPDKVLALVAQMDDPTAMPEGAGPVTHACPMHPEVTSDQPGRCPKCGMKLLAVTPGTPEHGAMDHEAMDHGDMDHGAIDPEAMGHGDAEGIEWEDDMVQVNRLTTSATMALAVPGPHRRRRQPRHRLDLHRRGSGQAPAGQ